MLLLVITLAIEAMTLLSWVVTQTYEFDTADNTVTFTTKELLIEPSVKRYILSDVQNISLVPKTGQNACSYYISLQLQAEEVLDIDLTRSASVDRVIAQQIQQFLILNLTTDRLSQEQENARLTDKSFQVIEHYESENTTR